MFGVLLLLRIWILSAPLSKMTKNVDIFCGFPLEWWSGLSGAATGKRPVPSSPDNPPFDRRRVFFCPEESGTLQPCGKKSCPFFGVGQIQHVHVVMHGRNGLGKEPEMAAYSGDFNHQSGKIQCFATMENPVGFGMVCPFVWCIPGRTEIVDQGSLYHARFLEFA